MILGLDHVILAVPALAPAVAAYRTLLGQPCAEGRFALANTVLHLRQSEAPPGLAAAAFAVAEPERAARLLERRGLAFGHEGDPLALTPATTRGLPLRLSAPGAPGPAATRLDHLVIRSGDPERTLALLGGRLGLELRLDRSAPQWGTRFLFFRCGGLVVEVTHALAEGITGAPDTLWGLTWGVADIAAEHARLQAAGMAVSPLRTGRKPGTRIFTVKDPAVLVPTAVIGA